MEFLDKCRIKDSFTRQVPNTMEMNHMNSKAYADQFITVAMMICPEISIKPNQAKTQQNQLIYSK